MDPPPAPGEDPDYKMPGFISANPKHSAVTRTVEWLNMDVDAEDGHLTDAIAGKCYLDQCGLA